MAFFVLEYELVDDYRDRRAGWRHEHLALAHAANDRGELFMAGVLAEPADRALFVWSTDDPEVVEEFAAADPYVRHGLVKSWTVRPWTVVVGEGAATS